MNYIVLINDFWDKALEHKLSAKQIALYFALLDRANRLDWQEWICVPNTVLSENTRLTIDEVRSCRKRLINSGLIEFKQGGHKQAGSYKISDRQVTAKQPPSDRQDTSEKDSENQWKIEVKNNADRQVTAKQPPSDRIYKTININNKQSSYTLEDKDIITNKDYICPKQVNLEGQIESDHRQEDKIRQAQEQVWFDEIYALYPRHEKRTVAYNSFVKLNPNKELTEAIKKHVAKLKKTEQWITENGKYVPLLSTYLNQKRWTDEVGVKEVNNDEISEDSIFYPLFGNRKA